MDGLLKQVLKQASRMRARTAAANLSTTRHYLVLAVPPMAIAVGAVWYKGASCEDGPRRAARGVGRSDAG